MQHISIPNTLGKWREVYDRQLFMGNYLQFQYIRYTSNKRSDEHAMVDLMHNLDSKVHGAIMGPTWVLSAQMGPMFSPWTLLSGYTILDVAQG